MREAGNRAAKTPHCVEWRDSCAESIFIPLQDFQLSDWLLAVAPAACLGAADLVSEGKGVLRVHERVNLFICRTLRILLGLGSRRLPARACD